MLAKLNDFAKKVSENSAISVSLDNNGVYWLQVKDFSTQVIRTFHPVGYDKCGIKYMRNRITEYFADK